MAITHPTAVRNAIADLIDDRVNAGAAAGRLKVYHTSINHPTDTNLLVNFALSDPAFGAAVGGVITAGSIATTNATGTGTASLFILVDSDGNEVFRGSVSASGGGGDLIITNTNIASGDPIGVVSFTYTAPV